MLELFLINLNPFASPLDVENGKILIKVFSVSTFLLRLELIKFWSKKGIILLIL